MRQGARRKLFVVARDHHGPDESGFVKHDVAPGLSRDGESALLECRDDLLRAK